MTMLESTRMMLEFNVIPKAEAQPNLKDEDLDRESLSSAEQQRLRTMSLGTKKKQTYRAIDGTMLV